VGALANIGWWHIGETSRAGGRHLNELIEVLAEDLRAHHSIALGFEAPLFVPAPASLAGLAKQRMGEAGRPWCAGAGCTALAMGVQQSAFVVRELARTVGRPVRVGFDPAPLLSGDIDLVIWEAFVSGNAKDRLAEEPHIADARVAAEEFLRRLSAGSVHSDIEDTSVLNLAAAGLLAAGLTDDIGLLSQPCVAVKAPELIA